MRTKERNCHLNQTFQLVDHQLFVQIVYTSGFILTVMVDKINLKDGLALQRFQGLHYRRELVSLVGFPGYDAASFQMRHPLQSFQRALPIFRIT